MNWWRVHGPSLVGTVPVCNTHSIPEALTLGVISMCMACTNFWLLVLFPPE
jgi:hypothetical protein